MPDININTSTGVMTINFLDATGGGGGNADHSKTVPVNITLGELLSVQLPGKNPQAFSCRVNGDPVDPVAEASRTLQPNDRVNVAGKNIEGG